jgi:hypothetical protein
MDRHLERQPQAVHLDQTADEILNTLADYLAKLGASHPPTRQN